MTLSIFCYVNIAVGSVRTPDLSCVISKRRNPSISLIYVWLQPGECLDHGKILGKYSYTHFHSFGVPNEQLGCQMYLNWYSFQKTRLFLERSFYNVPIVFSGKKAVSTKEKKMDQLSADIFYILVTAM